MKPEETVDYNIKVCWHAISRMYNGQASQHGFTTSTGFVLLNINQQEGIPATKIAPLLGLESRSLTRILKAMEQDGLIYRQADQSDKRSVRIFLTQKGLQKREVSRQAVKQFNQKVQDQIPQEDLQVFFKVITRITRMIDNKEIL